MFIMVIVKVVNCRRVGMCEKLRRLAYLRVMSRMVSHNV